MAGNALLGNKTRTFLTILGVSIGVFMITAILGLVNSLEKSVTGNISKLGNTTIFVHKWPWNDTGDDWYKYINRPQVTYKDYIKVKRNLKNVTGIYLRGTVGGQVVRYDGRSLSGVAINAVTEDMNVIEDYELYAGRHFTDLEYFTGRNVCVLGYNLWKDLFDEKPALGKYIRIGGKKILVVGVLKKQGISLGPSADELVQIPYEAAARMYDMRRKGIEKVLSVQAVSYEKMPAVESELTGLMRAARGLKAGVEDNFSLNKQEMLMKMMGTFFGIMGIVGWIFSSSAILVGVFGIGLIMYISVKERTREIGIQKALGSVKNFILFQFLAESIIICVLGGILGIIFSYFTIEFVQHLIGTDLPLVLSMGWEEIQVSLGLSIGMGILAGLIPAFLAAKLDPVIAIRQG